MAQTDDDNFLDPMHPDVAAAAIEAALSSTDTSEAGRERVATQAAERLASDPEFRRRVAEEDRAAREHVEAVAFTGAYLFRALIDLARSRLASIIVEPGHLAEVETILRAARRVQAEPEHLCGEPIPSVALPDGRVVPLVGLMIEVLTAARIVESERRDDEASRSKVDRSIRLARDECRQVAGRIAREGRIVA